MTPLISMRDALTSPDYFGSYLAGRSWDAWRILLIAIMGEELTPDERVTFETLTGRPREPDQPVRAFWAAIGRRGGKSRAMSVLASYIAACCDHRAALAPGETGVLPILAASTKQATQLFRYIEGVFDAVPAFQGLVESSTGDTIRLVTDVEIRVQPASWRTVRSITAVSCICDEIAMWRNDDSVNPDAEILAALRPALLTTGGLLIGISSPYAQAGELYKAWKRHWGPEGDPRTLVAKASTLEMNPGLSAEGRADIAQAFEDDPASASAEYGGNFRTDVETFLTPENIVRVTEKGVFERSWREGTRYVAFVDPSGGAKDSMTLAIAHAEGTDVVLDVIREVKPPFSPEGVTQDFALLLKSYRTSSVIGDRYGGEWTREPFTRHGIAYDLSDKSKSEIYQAVLPLINSNRAILLDNARLAHQLAGLERRTARGGRDSIDHARGGHDDVANAVAGALVLAASEKPKHCGFAIMSFDGRMVQDFTKSTMGSGLTSSYGLNPTPLRGKELLARMAPPPGWR